MFSKNILLVLTVALATFGAAAPAAAPVEKRAAIKVDTDGKSASVTPKFTHKKVTSKLDVVVESSDAPEAAATEEPADLEATAELDAAADAGGKADVASAVADIALKVYDLVQSMVDKDIARRQTLTQQTVAGVQNSMPAGQTVVMSNVGYSLSCAPIAKKQVVYKAKVGSNVTFDVLVFGKGCTFTLKGNGGFENWAYSTACKASGKTITC